jgi:hypothetical protein
MTQRSNISQSLDDAKEIAVLLRLLISYKISNFFKKLF